MQDRLDIALIEANLVKLQAETVKLHAETTKLNRAPRWLPLVYVAALFGAALAFAKFFQ